MNETDIRKAEQYRLASKKIHAHSEGLGMYLTIAGAGLLISGLFFGGGDSNPMFVSGVGLCVLLGGGGYWLHAKSENQRIWNEVRGIEQYFASKGARVSSDGKIEQPHSG